MNQFAKRTIIAAFAMTLAGNVVAEDKKENIASNSSFEQWVEFKGVIKKNKTPKMQDKQIPKDWNVGMHTTTKGVKVTGAVLKDVKVKHKGESSIRIENSTSTDISEVIRWDLMVKPNTTYKISVWVKGKDITLNSKWAPGAAIWASAGPEKGFWGNKKGIHKFMKQGGSFDWTQLTCEFTTRKIDEQMIVNIQLRQAKGTLWIDDIEIIEQNK